MPKINFNDVGKSYTAAMLKLFSDYRLDIDGTNEYEIPLFFGSASRLYKRLSTKTRGVSIRLPAMSLDISNYEPDLARNTSRILKKKVISLNDDDIRINFNQTSINLNFSMTLLADSMTSLTNITEFIIANFNNNIRYFDFKAPLGEIVSTPIRLLSVSNDSDNFADDYAEDRALRMNFEFMIEGFVDHPYTQDAKKLKQIQIMMYDRVIEDTALIESFNIDAS